MYIFRLRRDCRSLRQIAEILEMPAKIRSVNHAKQDHKMKSPQSRKYSPLFLNTTGEYSLLYRNQNVIGERIAERPMRCLSP